MIPPCFLDELPSYEPGEDTSSQQDETSQEDDVLEVIQLVNKEQEAAGQEHLEVDEDFMELAQIRAMEWRKAGLITYNTENEPSIPPNSPEYPEDKYHIEVTTDTQTETEARNKKTYSYSDAIGQLTIRKHDQDEKGLDGALFDIDVAFTDGTHTTVQGWEVDNGAWLFTWTYPQDNHNPATVTVKEVQAPRGYLMDTQSQTAVVAPTYSNHQNWRHTAGRGAFSAAEAPKTQEALMAFKFLGQRQLGKLPSRWVSTILMVAIYLCHPCGDLDSRDHHRDYQQYRHRH